MNLFEFCKYQAANIKSESARFDAKLDEIKKLDDVT